MVVIVPLWFYEFGSIMYSFAAMIGLLLAYFSFKLYNISQTRPHMLLHSAFIFITAGFLALLVGNIYSYYNFYSCASGCRIDPTNPTYFWIRFGNYGYYTTTLIGYLLLALSYMKLKAGRKIVFAPQIVFVLYPFINSYFQIFHLLAIVILSYIVLRTWSNYKKIRTNSASLVTIGFLAILFYHALMYNAAISPAFFALAHFSLLVGFGSLLLMLVRVNRK